MGPQVHESGTTLQAIDPQRLDPPPAGGQIKHRKSLIGLALSLAVGGASLYAQQNVSDTGGPRGDSYSGNYTQQAPSNYEGQQQEDPTLEDYTEPLTESLDPGPSGGGQALGAEQLEQLVAPIALYPDALVAQVLAASTYPEQVKFANEWRQSQGNASPGDIAAGADAQGWDPSLKALTAFPQVLEQMAQNLQWTSDLGNAYYNQPQDVLGAVQVMRQRARQAGNLESTPQETVNYDQGNIELDPPNQDVVYVPSYDPWSVYGRSVSPYPGFSLVGALGQFLGSSPVSYGLGMVMTAFGQTPWGWLGWGLNWLSQSVLFEHHDYFSHSNTVADWGLPHGGPRGFGYRNGSRGAGGNYARLPNRIPRGYEGQRDGYGGGLGQRFARASGNYLGNRAQDGSHGAYQAGGVYTRRPLVTRNDFRAPPSGSQLYGRPESGIFNRPVVNGIRPGSVYSGSTYRPQTSYARADFGRPSSGFGGRESYRENSGGYSHGFAGRGETYSKPKESGGFHPFGGGHSSKSYGGGERASAGSYGGGHGFFGGHSGGGHGFSGGGGHGFFGGHSGGRHSSGGHSVGHGGGHSARYHH